ncbi:aldo/keto reductase [Naasia sp. SYSU D00057]|uniref:aldo/keto reductase n=1 Tax=Naasia sp. SYSU D00057 TaxID=2817380 RepID=UPI001B30974C|nr:aldo/keto reductase [Naasia sp. SYSU D00057]
MEYRNLGRSGLRVSAVGLGCNNLGRPGTASESAEGAAALVGAALDSGVTLFDTADIYGARFGLSEELLGSALQGRRDEAIIATKFGHTGVAGDRPSWQDKGSRRYIRLAVEDSLRRLRTDHIDLYQLHTPDPHTPIEETLAALDELVREGKVRYLGSSNLAAWQVVEAEFLAREAGGSRFVSAQNEYSLLARDAEKELLPVARRYGIGFLPYFPLYNGIFTGKYTSAGGPKDSRIMRQKRGLLETVPWDAVDRFAEFASARGLTMLEATIGWLLAVRGLTSVIAGATTAEQVRQNAAAADVWRPTPDEMAEVAGIFR